MHSETNDRSKKISQARNKSLAEQMPPEISAIFSSKDRCGLLFEDARRRVIHMRRMEGVNPDSECTFSPNTRETKEYLQESAVGQRSFLQRNELFLLGRAEHRKHALSLQNKSFSYVPTIGRAPKTSRHESYASPTAPTFGRKRLSCAGEAIKSAGRLAAENEISRVLVGNRVETCFRKIFEVLYSSNPNEDKTKLEGIAQYPVMISRRTAERSGRNHAASAGCGTNLHTGRLRGRVRETVQDAKCAGQGCSQELRARRGQQENA